MPDLWQTLGYDAVALEIAGALSESADIAVLQGPPGVGKSWLAKSIGGLWEDGGRTVVAEGDALKRDVAYYPFGLAMVPLAGRWKSMLGAAAGIARAGEVLLGTAGIITTTVEALAKVRGTRRRSRTPFLGDAEQEILSELERLGQNKPMLLIADNLHWWDSNSLGFLAQLRDPRMWEAFPFLAELRVLAVQTPEPYQSVAHPEAHDAVLAPSSTRYFDLRRIPRAGFEVVLAALGAGAEPPASVADSVYAFSGGHLALAGRCADRIAKGESDVFLSAADSDDFVRRLLTDRIRSLGAMGQQAVVLLQIAAVLGLTFRRDEVLCASGLDELETSRLLRYCRDERVLDLTEEIGKFVHDLYRQYFLSAAMADRTGIHERLADCLRVLRPADYDLRCLNALDAERAREAAALAGQAALQRQRDGRAWQELPALITSAIVAGGLSAAVERLMAALEHLNRYRFNACLESLDGLPHDLPKSLRAEADIIRAMCLMSTRSEDDRASGRSVLEQWVGYEDEEPELGVRVLQLLVYGLTHLRDKEPGRALEGRIKRLLIDRVSFDLSAQDALYTMDRSSASLYPPEVSVVRTREAAAYYGPSAEQTVLRRPLEYYRCLVNYGANLISTAQYADARTVYGDLQRLVAGYEEGVFPRLDLPRTNMLLAEYRLGIADAEEAARRQQAIVDALRVESDPFYVENALAVYLTLAGREDEALRIFDRLGAELMTSRRHPEPSMVYLLRANRAATLYVSGEAAAAQQEWMLLSEVVDEIAYTIRPLLVRRHELLAEVVRSGRSMSGREFDEYLVRRGPLEFGPLWDNFGRGFRMPEIEFWRDN